MRKEVEKKEVEKKRLKKKVEKKRLKNEFENKLIEKKTFAVAGQLTGFWFPKVLQKKTKLKR